MADSGLACHYAQISSPQALTSHSLFGHLFETAMAGEILKQSGALPQRPACYHWRSAGGAEVDLLLERDGTLYPVEIKLTAAPTRRMASGIEAFHQAQLRVAKGLLLCAIDQPRWLSETVLAVPWNLV